MNLEKLIKIQKKIANQIEIKKLDISKIKNILAFDISFDGNKGHCCGIVLDKSFNILEEEYIKKEVRFPYIPTFLAFREIDLILKVFKKIKSDIDLVLIDGNGILHPRKCGIATHFGVMVKKPTIGVSKSYLFGSYKEPANKKFSYSYVYNKEKEIIGIAFRTKENTKPVFISIGNFVDLNSSVKIIKKLITKYRIPQPLRLAHIKSNIYRKAMLNIK